MTDTSKLADQVAAVDVLAVANLVLSRGRHGVMSASLAAIIAMAERIRDLDAVAAATAELLGEIDACRGIHAVDTFRATAAISPVLDGLTNALAALGYLAIEPLPLQGDDR